MGKEIFGECCKNYSSIPGKIETDGCKRFYPNIRFPGFCSSCGCDRHHHVKYITVDLIPTPRPSLGSGSQGSSTQTVPAAMDLSGWGGLVNRAPAPHLCIPCRKAIEKDGGNVGLSIGEANGIARVLHHGVPLSMTAPRMQQREGPTVDETADTLPSAYFEKPTKKRGRKN